MQKSHFCEYYTKKYNKNQFLFQSFTKNNWIENLINPNSCLFDIIKEEVEELYQNTGSFVTKMMHFDDLYALATIDTIRQFNKNLNKKTSWFESVCGDNVVIYKKVKQRLVKIGRAHV